MRGIWVNEDLFNFTALLYLNCCLRREHVFTVVLIHRFCLHSKVLLWIPFWRGGGIQTWRRICFSVVVVGRIVCNIRACEMLTADEEVFSDKKIDYLRLLQTVQVQELPSGDENRSDLLSFRVMLIFYDRKKVVLGSFFHVYFLWFCAERLNNAVASDSDPYTARRSNCRCHQKNHLVGGAESPAVPHKQKIKGRRPGTLPKNCDVLVPIFNFGFKEKGPKSSFGNSLAELHTFGLRELITWCLLLLLLTASGCVPGGSGTTIHNTIIYNTQNNIYTLKTIHTQKLQTQCTQNYKHKVST